MKLAVMVAVVFWVALAHADPRARCSAAQLGKRTVARVELSRFFDKELLRLVRLGLEGRLRVKIALIKRRTAWFDDVVLTVDRELVVTWDDERRVYLVDDLPVDTSALEPLVLERVSLGRQAGETAGTHYLEVSVRLQVVTVSSIMSAADWASGGGASRRDLVSTRVARAVVEDLTRKASTGCEVKRGP